MFAQNVTMLKAHFSTGCENVLRFGFSGIRLRELLKQSSKDPVIFLLGLYGKYKFTNIYKYMHSASQENHSNILEKKKKKK